MREHVIYADRLASYISDASTVRVRTLEQYGRAPRIEAIKAMQAEHKRRRSVPWNGLLAEKHDDNRRVSSVRREEALFAAPEPETKKPRRPVESSQALIGQVAKAFGLTTADILKRDKRTHVSEVRFLIARLLVDRGNSSGQVGAWMKRDHTTIINSLRRFSVVHESNIDIAKAYAFFREKWGLNNED